MNKNFELENRHYNRLQGFLKYDIEGRNPEEQKIVLEQVRIVVDDILNSINKGNFKKEDSNRDLQNKSYEIWSTMIDLELELLEGDKEKEDIMLEQMLKATQDKINTREMK